MPEPDFAVLVVRLGAAPAAEAHDLVTANPWLLDGGVDEAIGDRLAATRRRGDGPHAEALEQGRRVLQRYREFGAERALAREVLDRFDLLDPATSAGGAQTVPADALQAELRRRIDGSLAIGDVRSWDHWVGVSIVLEHTAGPQPRPAAAAQEAGRAEGWARRFLAERDADAQLAILRAAPPTPEELRRLHSRVGAAHLVAAHERDAMEVIHLRRSLALAATGDPAAFAVGYLR